MSGSLAGAVAGRVARRSWQERWRHDKEARSTHGVNCTGSCSWKVYVKDGIITWETQQTDYPTAGPDSPEYEPRGCPRGASFSWYTYSPEHLVASTPRFCAPGGALGPGDAGVQHLHRPSAGNTMFAR